MNATSTIKINIDPSGAISGAQRVNAALGAVGGNPAGIARVNQLLAQLGQNGRAGAAGVGAAGAAAGAANNNATGFAGVLERIVDRFKGLGGVAGAAAQGVAGAGSAAAGAASSFAGLSGIAVAGGFLAIGAGAVALGSKVVEVTSQVEAFKASLQTITGDSASASAAFDSLAAFAAKTPFSIDQAVESFSKLRVLGLTATENAMTSYGNTASAMGKDMNQMIEAVADAVTGENERLKEFGIKAKVNGDKVSYTFAGVTTTVGNNSKEIQDYLISLGNTNFGGAMERQAQTIGGAMGGLSDKIFLAFAAMGEGKFSAEVQKIINGIGDGIASLTPILSGIGSVMGSVMGFVTTLVGGVGTLFSSIVGGGSGVTGIINEFAIGFRVVGQVVEVLGVFVTAAFNAISSVVGTVTGTIRSTFAGLFSWLPDITSSTGQSMGESIIGVLRAAKFVATSLPQVFQIALKSVGQMFAGLGSIVMRLLSGDFSALADVGSVITGSLNQTVSAISKVGDQAGKVFADVKRNRSVIAEWTGQKTVGAIDDIKGGKTGDGKTAPSTSGADKAAKEAAERQKRADEFWATLQNQAKTAAMLPIEAENYNKQLDLAKILGRDLNKTEADRVNTLLAQSRIAKMMTDLRASNDNDARELTFQRSLLSLTERQKAVTTAAHAIEAKALEARIPLTDAALQAEIERAKVIAGQKFDLDAQADSIREMTDLLTKYSAKAQQRVDLTNLTKERDKIIADTTLNVREKEEALRNINNEITATSNQFRVEFGNSIDDLGKQFRGKLGAAISGIGSLISNLTKAESGDFSGLGPVGGIIKGLSGIDGKIGDAASDAIKKSNEAMTSGATWANPAKAIGDGFSGFKGDLRNMFGKGGDFSKGLGSVLGKLGAGQQIGSTVAGIGNMVGLKMSQTGAQIGGAIGEAVGGPIGSLIGSLGGGIIGNLFKKAKYATSNITIDAGDLGSNTVGNSGKRETAATGAASSVISGLESIASQLGGIISGTPSVSIGTYKDKWRVSTTGATGKLKFKGATANDLYNFDDDQEAAIKFAIQDAIGDGVLTGIDKLSQNILKSTKDLDKALSLSTQWEGILKDLRAYDNPVAGAVEDMVKSFQRLRDELVKNGATATDLANADRWYTIKKKEALDTQLKDLNDFLADLRGEASGKSGFALLTSNLSKFSGFEKDLKAGKTINQGDFTSLGQTILGEAKDIYGTSTSAYAEIVKRLTSASNLAVKNTTSSFDAATKIDATTAAINAQTDKTTQQQAIANDYLRQLVQQNAQIIANTAPRAAVSTATNGRLGKAA